MALLRIQGREHPTIAADLHHATLGAVVRPLHPAGTLETEIIATDLDAFARDQTHVTLLLVAHDHGHRDQENGDARVCHLHTEVGWLEAPQARRQATMAGVALQPGDNIPQHGQADPGGDHETATGQG